VVKNEDADGLDRIKVRFPWMQDTETTPWISVMVPYAGSNRGMRFTPEVDEEVLIDFADNNAERPFMIGSFYTTANTSGIPHEGNNIKAIVSRTGRRFEIDDDQGAVRMYDNYIDKTPKNGILLKRKDDDQQILLESQVDSDNYTVVMLEKGDTVNLGVVSGGELKAEIRIKKDGPDIIIHSKGSININAEGDLNLESGGSIKMSATNKIEIKSDAEIKVKGMSVEVESDTTLDLKGLNAKLEGSAQLEAKGGAMASLSAAIVKIN